MNLGNNETVARRNKTIMTLFEVTASALDSAQASLAPPVDLTTLRVLCVYALRASDERTEPQAESKVEAVVSKRAYVGGKTLGALYPNNTIVE